MKPVSEKVRTGGIFFVCFCIAMFGYWATDTKVRIPKNVTIHIDTVNTSREVTDPDVKAEILNQIKSLRLKRNLAGAYLNTGNYTKTEGTAVITMWDSSNEQYEVRLLAQGESFISTPQKGKFIIKNKEKLVEYLESL